MSDAITAADRAAAAEIVFIVLGITPPDALELTIGALVRHYAAQRAAADKMAEACKECVSQFSAHADYADQRKTIERTKAALAAYEAAK